MKIILTIADVKKLVAAQLSLSEDKFELKIESNESLLVPILAVFGKIAPMIAGNKIGAIKMLRSSAPDYGLWEAKIVVENFSAAVEMAKRHKAWPMPIRGTDQFGPVFAWRK